MEFELRMHGEALIIKFISNGVAHYMEFASIAGMNAWLLDNARSIDQERTAVLKAPKQHPKTYCYTPRFVHVVL
jgi:hypothetical protein